MKKKGIYAPIEQQIEGMKTVLEKIPVSLIKKTCYYLYLEKFCSKSTYWSRMKILRKAAGLSWKEFWAENFKQLK